MMLKATEEFSDLEVKPNLMRFEEKDYKLVENLMRKAGQLGLLAISVPEKYQGLGMGFNTGMLICEEISSLSGSVATAFGHILELERFQFYYMEMKNKKCITYLKYPLVSG